MSYKILKDLESDIDEAKRWINLESKTDDNISPPEFFISEAHSELILVMAGKPLADKGNHCSSPTILNNALISAVIKHRKLLFKEALKNLKMKKDRALLECETQILEVMKDTKQKIKQIKRKKKAQQANEAEQR